MAGSILIIGLNFELIPNTIKLIFKSAFYNYCSYGGFLGASVMLAMRSGVARGVFQMNLVSEVPHCYSGCQD